MSSVGVKHADLTAGVSRVAAFLQIGAIVNRTGGDEEDQSEEDADREAADVRAFALAVWVRWSVPGRGKSLLSRMSHWCKLGALCADCCIYFQNMIYCKNYKLTRRLPPV